MYAYIKNNLNLPKSAYEINETAYLAFIVDKKGKISYLKDLKPFNHPDIKKEILRVINKMPKWTPGKCKGKPVDVLVQIPIKFFLN
jgi:protein TonB